MLYQVILHTENPLDTQKLTLTLDEVRQKLKDLRPGFKLVLRDMYGNSVGDAYRDHNGLLSASNGLVMCTGCHEPLFACQD